MKRLMVFFLSIALAVGLLSGSVTALAEDAKSAPESADVEVAWPRIYVDGTGAEVVIEKQPERVAVLHFGQMAWVLSLGTPLVASALAEEIDSWTTLEALRGTGVTNLGEVMAPDLEKLVEAEPDLIFGTYDLHGSVWEELEKIAPVVETVSPDPYSWTDALREYGKVLGKEKEAEAHIAAVEAKVAAAREKLASLDETVIVIRNWADGKSGGISGKDSESVYSKENGLGLKAPDTIPDAYATLTLEGVAAIQADHIFLMEFTPEEYAQSIAELSKSSVWNSLPAVKNNRVYYLDVAAYAGGPLGLPLWADYAVETLLK